MGDKCDSHDDCFKRLYSKIEDLSGEIRAVLLELKDLHHKKALLIAELAHRIERCEDELTELRAGRAEMGRRGVGIAFDLLRYGIAAILGAAAWAFANGFGK